MSNSPWPTQPEADETTPGLSADELAERELLAVMSSSPPPLNGIEGDEEVDELTLDTDAPSISSTSISLTTPTSMRTQLAVARRKAAQLKLHPYQRDLVEEFIKGSSEFKQTMLYMQLCVVENQVIGIKAAAPPFVSSPQLLENIKSFVIAVLLSSKLSAYKKESVPVDHVMAILTSVPRTYLPENLSGDSYALKIVKRDISEELTQTRSRIKKAIKDSLGPTGAESDTIFELATVIVAHSQSLVTVPLCARIAMLRKVFVETPGSNYWDKVDARLLFIRNMGGPEIWKVTRAFEHILQSDRNTYGDNTTYTIPDGTTDDFQSSVDIVVSGIRGNV